MYPHEVSTFNSDTCLPSGYFSNVHIVGVGHYVDGFIIIYINMIISVQW